MTVLQDALAYAAQGWPVFPIHTWRDGRCSCGKHPCGSPAKHPRTLNGLKDATVDPERIRQYGSHWEQSNVGLATGPVAGVFVVDIDKDKGGYESTAQIEATYDTMDTLECATGGGGSHLYFLWPDGITEQQLRNSAGKLGYGIDVRAAGGYVLLPPSLHRSGDRYWWCEAHTQPQTAPRWLIDLLVKPPEPPPRVRPKRPPLPFQPKPGRGYVEKAINDELAKLAATRGGECHDALTRSAFRIGQLDLLGIPEDEVIEALADAALTNAKEPKSREAAVKTAAECFAAGKDHPREVGRRP
jgi:Bifunctional DNA primase/polymerase, N-terminal